MTDVRELTTQEWEAEREAAARTFLGIGAAEFADRFNAGEYDGDNEPDMLMAVLALFPELD